MYLHFVIYGLLLNFTLCEALFLWKEKAMFLCSKVCPAYCSSRRRRRDVGPSFLGYDKDEPPPYWPEFWPDESSDYIPIPLPVHKYHWVYKPTEKEKTTTTPPPTTTKEPSFICVVCAAKCGVTTPKSKPEKEWDYGSWTPKPKQEKEWDYGSWTPKPKEEKEWAYGTGPWALKYKLF